MRVIKVKTLGLFWAKHPDAEGSLRAWFAEAEQSHWEKSQDIIDQYRYADILPGNRAVFNIKGNRYRLVVNIHYNTGVVYIRFVGTHAEYDRIDAEKI